MRPLLPFRLGIGAAAAFTSDLGTRWGRDWVDWSGYRGFVRQLTAAISRSRKVPQVSARAEVGPSGEGVVLVEDLSPTGGLELGARVVDPSGLATTLSLRIVGPGRAEGTFPLTGRGRYRVEALGRRPGLGITGDEETPQERAFANLVVPYDREYLRFRADRNLLGDIARRTGGRPSPKPPRPGFFKRLLGGGRGKRDADTFTLGEVEAVLLAWYENRPDPDFLRWDSGPS